MHQFLAGRNIREAVLIVHKFVGNARGEKLGVPTRLGGTRREGHPPPDITHQPLPTAQCEPIGQPTSHAFCELLGVGGAGFRVQDEDQG